MAECFGDERPGGGMVAAFTLVDVFEDCYAFLWLDAALEDSSNTAPNKLSVHYCVCSGSVLDLSCRDLVSRQLSVYQEVEDGLGP